MPQLKSLSVVAISALALIAQAIAPPETDAATKTKTKTTKPAPHKSNVSAGAAKWLGENNNDTRQAVEYCNAGYQAEKAKNHQLAVRYYQLARQADPTVLATYLNEGGSYLSLKRPDLAIDVLTKGINLDRKNKESDEKYWELYHNRGLAWLQAQKPDKAIADFTIIMQHEEASNLKALSQTSRGGAYALAGDYKKAFQDFNTVLALRQTDKLTQHARAVANYEMQLTRRQMQADLAKSLSSANSSLTKTDYSQALTVLDRALKIDPNNSSALLLRASTYGHINKQAEAQADLALAQKLNPKDGKVAAIRGEVALANHDTDQAIAEFKNALTMNYINPAVYAGLATAQLTSAQFDEAVKSINEAIRLSPNDSNLYNLRSLAYLIADTPENALSDANRYLEKTNWQGAHTPDCFLRVYMLSKQLGNEQEASKSLELASSNIKPDAWSYNLVRFLKNETDSDKLIAAANTSVQKTDAGTWIAINTGITGNKEKAIEELTNVKNTGSHDSDSFLLAVIQLARLNGTYRPKPVRPLDS